MKAPNPPLTETPNARYAALDTYSTQALVDAFIDHQALAVAAVRAVAGDIAQAVHAALPRIERGGRLIYVGAGTSGRLGLLDCVELAPTFSWPEARSIALLAGGDEAIFRAVEGAEDSASGGAAAIDESGVGPDDVVIVLAASGSTPYALGALVASRVRGALTIGFANNPDAALTREAEIGITLDTGPEVISGSTRLTAGTAQKVALNAFSSSLMVRLNKVYGNLMVDVKPSNAKLLRRCVQLTMLATGCGEAAARDTLVRCDYHVKTAIVMLVRHMDVGAARDLLASVKGSVRSAIAGSKTA